ncbi:AAA family ATPase [Geotalea uraniireducens]|uniref:SMC domain protein n=1 Tax=Geotalea uraniireducens (strain Rf4) TaxID=351605 RepID=A5GFG5_GEOUR|nr:AAA family ATPase [Geotalea uraniireducens]ABQ26170.1 SMC domain protein [Geotalea uraniireducens Rf4]
MKVLRLSFKNLNSLAGVWDIDFKHPDYVSSGIFAITGPTGAGKTTILDAICLALYGQTPRLNRITQGENEIMSRQTGECFAEVEFETAKGRFRCHWSQHRSRKQADGQLQSPRHEIAEAESGMILESKLRAVADKVEDVTGMDFDRFTRSMLLAQGGFAAFLQARPDERAPILEQITGTAIYSRISIKVHERTSEERKRLGEMRAELDGIQLLSPAEAEALLREKSELQRAESTLTADARIIREAQSWRERIAALEGELLQLDQDRLAFETRKAAAAPELERLALAGRALKLGGDHAHILSMRTQQVGEQGELAAAAERLPQLQLGWQAAFDALELAEIGLESARVEQTREAELIRMTRALDVKLGEAQTQLNGLTADIEKTHRQNGDYRLAMAQCEQRMSETGEELQGVAAFLAEHQADVGLAEALTGIEQRLKALKTLDKQCRDTQAKLGRHAALIETATLTLSRAETVWQGALQAVTAAENRLAGVRAAREALLQGRDLSAWRDEAETLANRQSRLGAMQETLARIEEVKPKLAELRLRGEELEQKRQALAHREETLAAESELRERVARQLQDNVVLLNRVRSLEDDRKQLVDGVPCPLCGASEHPYAAGNIPQLDEAQKELELALAEAKRVRELLSRIELEQVAVGKDLQQAGQDQAELQERQLRDEAFCASGFVELGVSADAGAWSELIRHETDTCRGELVNRRGIIQEAEQKEQEERSAQGALNKLKDELAEHDKARLAARLGQEAAQSERKRLEGESAALHDDLDRVLAEVESAVAAYGCTEIVPDKVDELLAALTARRNAYVLRMQVRERLEKGRADLAAEREKQRALLAESEKTLADKEQQLRERTAQRDALVEQRLERYGERNPDVEEKRLADALRQAGERREAALQEQNRLQAELDGLNRQIERLTVSIARRGEQLFELETAFCLRLIDTGFADEAAFLQACLPQERFDELTQWADTLYKDETAIQTRQQDRKEALAGELNRNLTDKPLDLIREENAAVTEQLSELQKGLGALYQKLQQHAEQQQRHQSRLEAIEIQRRECDRWERLHALIGSGDGKRFRNFAQGLTFELMVAHANRQLQKMSDRYILVRDSAEPLELNVIDNYQAGEIRSTKNLSGGESFIASLALSLGLSSMASRNVRVDSLFLDEGFGTLDEDALETALETLSGLQQDGKLIGIISHVPALKERIGTQIQVEAGSAGRSTLSGPGCRRVKVSI